MTDARVALIALDDDDDEIPMTTSAPASDPIIFHPKYMKLKAEMDEKSREVEKLQKKVKEGKIKFNFMWDKAVELEKNKESMEREIAELKRKQDNPTEVNELTQDLRKQRRETERLQREVEDLRKEGDSRRTRIRELEQRLADATKKTPTCPTAIDYPGGSEQGMTASTTYAETSQPEDAFPERTREDSREPVHNLEFWGKKPKVLTRSSIALVRSLGCPVLNDANAPPKNLPWERAEWFLANTPTAAFRWVVDNVTGQEPMISCIFCPFCYTVLKRRSGSVALTVRDHYEQVHSFRRKCTYEGCRKRWNKNMNSWCFKYDASSHELLLDRVRCEKHSMKCAVERCKNRWFEGLPDSQDWSVERNADDSVNVLELKCPDHV